MLPKEDSDLATEAMVQSIPTPPTQPQQQAETSAPTSANTRRWIDSFSDCC
jgi:hypothetical protein